jgi:hypothetical protein
MLCKQQPAVGGGTDFAHVFFKDDEGHGHHRCTAFRDEAQLV